jgi:hypothetical protein
MSETHSLETGGLKFRYELSALSKCMTVHHYTHVVSKKDLKLARESERLQRKRCILKE